MWPHRQPWPLPGPRRRRRRGAAPGAALVALLFFTAATRLPPAAAGDPWSGPLRPEPAGFDTGGPRFAGRPPSDGSAAAAAAAAGGAGPLAQQQQQQQQVVAAAGAADPASVAPIAQDDAFVTWTGACSGALPYGLLDNDANVSPTSGVTLWPLDQAPPNMGTLAAAPTGGAVTYSCQNLAGVDRYRYYATEGGARSNNATVTIAVAPQTPADATYTIPAGQSSVTVPWSDLLSRSFAAANGAAGAPAAAVLSQFQCSEMAPVPDTSVVTLGTGPGGRSWVFTVAPSVSRWQRAVVTAGYAIAFGQLPDEVSRAATITVNIEPSPNEAPVVLRPVIDVDSGRGVKVTALVDHPKWSLLTAVVDNAPPGDTLKFVLVDKPTLGEAYVYPNGAWQFFPPEKGRVSRKAPSQTFFTVIAVDSGGLSSAPITVNIDFGIPPKLEPPLTTGALAYHAWDVACYPDHKTLLGGKPKYTPHIGLSAGALQLVGGGKNGGPMEGAPSGFVVQFGRRLHDLATDTYIYQWKEDCNVTLKGNLKPFESKDWWCKKGAFSGRQDDRCVECMTALCRAPDDGDPMRPGVLVMRAAAAGSRRFRGSDWSTPEWETPYRCDAGHTAKMLGTACPKTGG